MNTRINNIGEIEMNATFTFDFSLLPEELKFGAKEFATDYNMKVGSGVVVKAYENTHLKVSFDGAKEVRIGYSSKAEFFRGLIKAFHGEETEQKRIINEVTILVECAGGAIVNVATLKRLVRILSACGYTGMLLGITDVYKIKGQRMFGYMKGAYLEEEIQEVDAYAQHFGIEVIPCIQTLAHLSSLFRWPDYYSICDCNDILLCESEETYQLIDDMFAQLSRSFSTRKIHLGMDEAFLMGSGQYQALHGHKDRTEIFLKHLNRVMSLADKYGFNSFMGWGDSFVGLINNIDNKYGITDMSSILGKYADKVTIICYQYSVLDKGYYENLIDDFKKASDNVGFGGAVWRWTGFAPNNQFAVNVAKPALEACIEKNINTVIACAWSDDGGECPIFATLPAIVAYSEISYGDDLQKSFRQIVGYDIEDFYALDLPNIVVENPAPSYRAGYCKTFLYNDLFLGIFDPWVKKEYHEVFEKNIEILKKYLDDKGEFSYLFKTAYALMEAINAKFDLGVKITEAYQKKDKTLLSDCCADIDIALKKIQTFYDFYIEQWYFENKPNGAEIHDIRLGGLMNRMRAAKKRIQLFIDGKINRIQELEEEKINWLPEEEDGNWIHYSKKVGDLLCNGWKITATTNVL